MQTEGGTVSKIPRSDDRLKGENEVTFVVEGASPMLQHGFSDADIEEVLIRGKRPQKVTDKSLRDMARKGLYRGPNDEFGVPAMNLIACLVEAGRFVKVGRSNLSTAETTTLHGFLRIEGEFLPFKKQGEEIWVYDLRRGQMANGTKKTAVGIVRPKFPIWSFDVTLVIDFDEQGINLDTIKQLLRVAGRRCGLGSFRPQKRGPFGMFRVPAESWVIKPVKEGARAEA